MYRDRRAAPPPLRIVCRPVLRTFLVLGVLALPVLWQGLRFSAPRFQLTCDRDAHAFERVSCSLRERDFIGSTTYRAHDVRDVRVGFLSGQDRGTTFELLGRDGVRQVLARTNDEAGATRAAAKVEQLVAAPDATAAHGVDEAFGPAPRLLVIALAFIGLGVAAAVRALRRVELVVTRGEVRATSVGRGAPQVSRTVQVSANAVVRLHGEAKGRVLEIVTADGATHVLAQIGWLSERRARTLCARLEHAIAQAHAPEDAGAKPQLRS